MRSRVIAIALLAVATLGPAVLPASSAQAAALPLGKANFAIAIGGLRASSVENWVRLGQYTFGTDGTVTERHWHWSQRVRVTRSYTDFTASNCADRNCRVATGGGYQSTGASKTLTGTYSVTAGTLRVNWSSGQWEEWTLTTKADGALANVELKANNFGATHGFGNGSNAAWAARKSLSSIASTDWSRYIHRYHLWKTSEVSADPYIDTGDGNPFWLRNWNVCTGSQCIAGETGTPGTSTATEYYIAPANSPTGHRRDTLWGWRLKHAIDRKETCYTGNSHVKPMIQVVDDNGVFHGWVGVEASLNQTVPAQGALADDIGVFRILD
ncbi:hypothetical protein [Phytohabitans kaempferiae]|uniref:Uncharacterized protein n=1 Tax=Phytohabitans kaempferiae TaxID=1620943 RepID=A0ABV6M3M7_9ACTN